MKKKPKKKSSQHLLHQWYEHGDPEVRLLGEPSSKYDYFVLYSRKDESSTIFPTLVEPFELLPPSPEVKMAPHPYYKKALQQLRKEQPPIISPEINMFKLKTEEFPPLKFEDPSTSTKHMWKIPQPTSVDSEGKRKENSAAE